MLRSLFDFMYGLTYDEACKYKDKLNSNGTYDVWGDAIVWFPIAVNGIKYGAELNFACDAGTDYTAIYLMRSKEDDEDGYETDHDLFDEYSGMEIVKQITRNTVKEDLIEDMCKFVIEHIKTVIKKNTFINDIEKMIDFFSISKTEFLKSYSYLTEEEYDATKTYVKFINDLQN